MSRSPRISVGVLLLAAGLLAGMPGRARAQLTNRDLKARIDSLAPLVEQARSAAAAEGARLKAEQAARNTSPADTFMVGPIRIVTTPDEVGDAQRLFTEVWQQFQPWVQDSPELHRETFTYSHALLPPSLYVDGPAQAITEGAWRSDAYMKARIRAAIGNVLSKDLHPGEVEGPEASLARWVNNAIAPVDVSLHEEVYRQLVTAPSQAARACIAGDAKGCWTAMGVGVGPEPWKDWYSPAERRALIVRRLGAIGSRFYPDHYQKCADQHLESACDAILTKSAIGTYSMPLGGAARATLVWTALRLGGSGSWARLMALKDTPPEQALATVAGVSADELARTWRDDTLRNPPTVYAGGPWTHLLPLFWVLVFAGLAMRSTRWRLG